MKLLLFTICLFAISCKENYEISIPNEEVLFTKLELLSTGDSKSLNNYKSNLIIPISASGNQDKLKEIYESDLNPGPQQTLEVYEGQIMSMKGHRVSPDHEESSAISINDSRTYSYECTKYGFNDINVSTPDEILYSCLIELNPKKNESAKILFEVLDFNRSFISKKTTGQLNKAAMGMISYYGLSSSVLKEFSALIKEYGMFYSTYYMIYAYKSDVRVSVSKNTVSDETYIKFYSNSLKKVYDQLTIKKANIGSVEVMTNDKGLDCYKYDNNYACILTITR